MRRWVLERCLWPQNPWSEPTFQTNVFDSKASLRADAPFASPGSYCLIYSVPPGVSETRFVLLLTLGRPVARELRMPPSSYIYIFQRTQQAS